jgi:hypothetical protein
MQFPSSTKWSVISLIFLTSLIVLPLTYGNYKAKASFGVEKTYASAGLTPTPSSQNSERVETKAALAVTITTPEPTKTPAVSTEAPEEVSAVSRQQEEIIAFIKQTFGKDAEDAIKVARCESGLNPKAVGHNTDAAQSTDYGLFQINDHWQGVTNTNFLLDYKINTLMAKKIFDGRGNWSAWVCATKYNALGR